MKRIVIVLGVSLLAACGLNGNGNSNQNQNNNSNTTTVMVTVPASAQPSGATSAPSGAERPVALGAPATTKPTQPASMPSSVSPPGQTTNIVTINNTIITNVDIAIEADNDCAAYGLEEGWGYCDDDEPEFVTLCLDGVVWAFDCGSYGSSYRCGYLFVNDGELACVDAPDQHIAPSVRDDADFAYDTNIPCTEGDEGYGECQGDFAYYCLDGWVKAQDCGLYSIDGASATCGVSGSGLVDCGLENG